MPMDGFCGYCLELYVSQDGNDGWSGLLPAPNLKRSDGPKASVLGAAREIALRRKAGSLAGPVRVMVKGGRHFLQAPIELLPEHSWPSVYESYPGEEAVFDGGSLVKGWKEAELDGVRVWTAEVSDLLDARGRFRQLFVNGRRAVSSRSPKKGFHFMREVKGLDPKQFTGGKDWGSPDFGQDSFVSSPEGFDPAWRNIEDLEIVAPHFWITTRLAVKSFDPATRKVRLAGKSLMPFVDSGSGSFAKYYVENVVEALSEPGEWALDRAAGLLHYVPREGESIESSECFVTHLKQLLLLKGRPEEGEYVEHLTLRGLAFEHADWGEPMNSVQAEVAVPGTVALEGARNVVFEDCRFERLGCYAIQLGDGCRSNAVSGCLMRDLGAGGAIANGSDASGPLSRRNGDNSYTDNTICACGRVFPSACGIVTMHSYGNLISHNHIHDLFYTGVSCGWVWGYGDSVSRENRIEFNHIHDLGKGVLSDMGGVYTLGVQPGTRIFGNLIHDIERARYGGWAIYPDEGSSHIVIESNVCYNVSSSPFHQHYGRENLVVNNVFAFGKDSVCALSAGRSRNTGYAHPGSNFSRSVLFLRNIFLTDGAPVHTGGYGNKVEDGNVESDLNIVWDVSGREPVSGNPASGHGAPLEKGYKWEQWQELGYDLNSIVADPKFKDPANGDFQLPPDSPAEVVGFRRIDVSKAGPRPKGLRTGS